MELNNILLQDIQNSWTDDEDQCLNYVCVDGEPVPHDMTKSCTCGEVHHFKSIDV